MRYEVTVTEGDEKRKQLVPLATLLAIPGEFDGKTLNELIVGVDGIPPERWETWLTWHAMTVRQGETRPYEEWCDQVDWWELGDVDEEDPSGDQETRTDAPLLSSSPGAPAPGPSSSPSTTSSSTPSGLSSPEA